MSFSEGFNRLVNATNDIIWSDSTLFGVLAIGILFTLWTRFAPFYALKHGIPVLLGRYDDKNDPGAINHFQALSAALSATIGLGNIGGVAIAVAVGGPGAVFWMWVIGIVGMTLKTIETTAAMLYRNVDNPDNPHGGPMWVAKLGFREVHPRLEQLGKVMAVFFCLTTLLSVIMGGNMFQAWNVAEVTYDYFGIPKLITGFLLATITGLVIIGGIKRIGAVAGKIVPFMCGLYLISGVTVLVLNAQQVPAMFTLIIHHAFNPTQAQGAFIGGTTGYAFLWGMRRAMFSNEAGQGSAPMAHAAAKTSEPVREGILAGLGPFIDTLVICTITALIILVSGAWNRGPEGITTTQPKVISAGVDRWTLAPISIDDIKKGNFTSGKRLMILLKGDNNPETNNRLTPIYGQVEINQEKQTVINHWTTVKSKKKPSVDSNAVYGEYRAASLTGHAFDLTIPGLGLLLIPLASWLFAISTMISWCYYGEQAMIYLSGERWVLPYKFIYCLLTIAATLPILKTNEQIGDFSDLGTGLMLCVNLPILLIMGRTTVTAYRNYIQRLNAGEFNPQTKSRNKILDCSKSVR